MIHFQLQMLADALDAEVRKWSTGKEGNLRALLSTLQYVSWSLTFVNERSDYVANLYLSSLYISVCWKCLESLDQLTPYVN